MIHIRKIVSKTCFLILSPCLALGSVGPQFPSRPPAPKTDLPADSRTVLGVILGQSSLATVQEKLGPANMWAQGDASTAEEVVCYVTDEPHSIVIAFASNSEMAGPPDNEVTDITIVGSAAYPQRSKCRTISLKNLGTPSGLGLGITREKVRAILGAPLHSTSAKWGYLWSVDRPLLKSDNSYEYWLSRKAECFAGGEPFFSVNSGIDIMFDGDTVARLGFERIETIC